MNVLALRFVEEEHREDVVEEFRMVSADALAVGRPVHFQQLRFHHRRA